MRGAEQGVAGHVRAVAPVAVVASEPLIPIASNPVTTTRGHRDPCTSSSSGGTRGGRRREANGVGRHVSGAYLDGRAVGGRLSCPVTRPVGRLSRPGAEPCDAAVDHLRPCRQCYGRGRAGLQPLMRGEADWQSTIAKGGGTKWTDRLAGARLRLKIGRGTAGKWTVSPKPGSERSIRGLAVWVGPGARSGGRSDGRCRRWRRDLAIHATACARLGGDNPLSRRVVAKPVEFRHSPATVMAPCGASESGRRPRGSCSNLREKGRQDRALHRLRPLVRHRARGS
jgi:hypothetical protein